MKNIRDEILWLRDNHGVRRISFLDANFVPKSKVLELLKLLAEFQEPNMEFRFATMSVHHTDEEIIDSMVKAGMDVLPLAIESGVAKTLQKIDKHVDLDKARKLCEYGHAKNMLVKAFFMIGFPGETFEEVEETIRFAYNFNADWITVSPVTPFPGTKMFEQFVELGYISSSPAYWGEAVFAKRSFNTKEISAADLSEMAFIAILQNNYVNSKLILDGQLKKAEMLFLNVTGIIKTQIFGFDALRRVYRAIGDAQKEKGTIAHMISLMQTDEQARSYQKYFYLLESEISKVLTDAIERSA